MSQKPTDGSRSRTFARTLIAATALVLVFGLASAATAAPLVGTTTRISLDSAGTQGNSSSFDPAVSGDGRYITYSSAATNLVVGDTNLSSEIFLFDTTTLATTRVSVDSAAVQGNSSSADSAVSGDGRYITYISDASNLVVGDTNGHRDVFLFDRITAVTTRVSVNNAAVQGNADSSSPAISADGRYITYTSDASNLVVGDTNVATDVFLFDRITLVTTRISVDSALTQSNAGSSNSAISGDGRYITYISAASNLVESDTNVAFDAFLVDRITLVTTRISVDSAATQNNGNSFNPAISGDGRYITYDSDASNLVASDTNEASDVFLFALPAVAAVPALAATGSDPIAPLAIAVLLLGAGAGAFAVSYYRRYRTS